MAPWTQLRVTERIRRPVDSSISKWSCRHSAQTCCPFNICGNAYPLVVDMRYDLGRVYVRHVVTHAEYDRLIKRKLL